MIPMFCWQQSRNMRNKSGRLTKRKRFLCIELAIYRFLTWKQTLHLQFFFLDFDFSRKCEKSVANSEEHEIGHEIMRLTTKS